MICEGLRHIMKLQSFNPSSFMDVANPSSFFSLSSPAGVTCTPVWSSEPSATAATRSRRPTPRRANATWSAKERRATCVEEPTGCPSTGWSWARSQHAAVSRCCCCPSQEAFYIWITSFNVEFDIKKKQKDPGSTDMIHRDTEMLFLRGRGGIFVLFSGLTPQLGAGCFVVFTSSPPGRELCYLRTPWFCIPNNRLPAALRKSEARWRKRLNMRSDEKRHVCVC